MPTFSEFQSIVGPSYAIDEGRVAVLHPGSTDEIAAILRLCSKHQISLGAAGGGTKLEWGNPVQVGVCLQMGRLAGIREHVWQDLTATVGAGTRWQELNGALAKHGQQVALDPLMTQRATVGGVLAVNDSGALRIRYGSLRDLVIGMTIVLADGTVARSGGKVVKNVAGYDLPKLLIGSFGTLGVITEVNFRLHPVEAHAQSWTVRGAAERLGEVMSRLRESATTMQSVQLRSDGQEFALDVRFASTPGALEQDAIRLTAMCNGLTLTEANASVWSAREQLFAEADAAVLKITCLPSHLMPVAMGFAASAVQARCVGEAVGILTVQLKGEPELMLSLIQDLRGRLGASGGMVVVLRWPFDITPPERWGGSPPAIAVMRELKKQFDPGCLLNPGKFVGGI